MSDEPNLKVSVPMSREGLLSWIGHAMRNRAFPEFHQAPLPLWATDAAENILRLFESLGVVTKPAGVHELSREDEAKWDMGPIGPTDEIGCIVDGDYLVYVDGQGNPLEPGWVLAVLRGGPRAAMTAREARQHPWMPKRDVVVAVLPKDRPTN